MIYDYNGTSHFLCLNKVRAGIKRYKKQNHSQPDSPSDPAEFSDPNEVASWSQLQMGSHLRVVVLGLTDDDGLGECVK